MNTDLKKKKSFPLDRSHDKPLSIQMSTTPHCCEDLDGGNDRLCHLLRTAVGLPEVDWKCSCICWASCSGGRAASITNKQSSAWIVSSITGALHKSCAEVCSHSTGAFLLWKSPSESTKARTGERCRNAKDIGAQWVGTVWDAVVAGTSPPVFRMSL